MLYDHNTDAYPSPAIAGALSKLAESVSTLASRKDPKSADLLNLPSKSDDLQAIEDTARAIRARFKRLVVVGIGGSGPPAPGVQTTGFRQRRAPVQ